MGGHAVRVAGAPPPPHARIVPLGRAPTAAPAYPPAPARLLPLAPPVRLALRCSSRTCSRATLRRLVRHVVVGGKLVLGLVDGNFAVWDLASNETFMSRKHFSGKLKGEVSCGAWETTAGAPRGRHDEPGAAASSAAPRRAAAATPARLSRRAPPVPLQIKISQPLAAASWEATAAKIHIKASRTSASRTSRSRNPTASSPPSPAPPSSSTCACTRCAPAARRGRRCSRWARCTRARRSVRSRRSSGCRTTSSPS